MTTLLQIELTCPVCIRTFSSQVVLTADRSARTRTDFHEQPAGVQPLPYLVHTCSSCGYTGSDLDFGAGMCIAAPIATHVFNELAPKLPTGPITGSEKYELAAKVATWRGAAPEWIGELLLCAAWCCVDEGDVEAERYFRRLAACMFEAALVSWDGVAPDMRAVLTYLVGELWRRVGDLETAAAWFDRVRSEIVAPSRQRWIIKAAEQQSDDPREWFGCDTDACRPLASVGRSGRRRVAIKRGHRGGAGFLHLLRRAAAVAQRAVAVVVAGTGRQAA
jgi:uncharacterized protein